MHEAMMLFDTFVDGKWFKRKPIILFLNKIDLLKEKLAFSRVSEYFPDFNDSDTNVFAAADYFAGRFHGLNRTPDRKVYVHYTTATDTTLLKATMNSVHDVIVQSNLHALNI